MLLHAIKVHHHNFALIRDLQIGRFHIAMRNLEQKPLITQRHQLLDHFLAQTLICAAFKKSQRIRPWAISRDKIGAAKPQ